MNLSKEYQRHCQSYTLSISTQEHEEEEIQSVRNWEDRTRREKVAKVNFLGQYTDKNKSDMVQDITRVLISMLLARICALNFQYIVHI